MYILVAKKDKKRYLLSSALLCVPQHKWGNERGGTCQEKPVEMELEIGERGFTLCIILYHSLDDITSEPAGTGSILQGEDSCISSDDIHAVG